MTSRRSAQVQSNADPSGDTVALTGTSVQPEISLSPDSIDFGNVALGRDSQAEQVVISNPGTTDLNIEPLSITGDHAGDFGIGNDNCSGTSVPPEESCTFEVTFTATSTTAQQRGQMCNRAGVPVMASWFAS